MCVIKVVHIAKEALEPKCMVRADGNKSIVTIVVTEGDDKVVTEAKKFIPRGAVTLTKGGANDVVCFRFDVEDVTKDMGDAGVEGRKGVIGAGI